MEKAIRELRFAWRNFLKQSGFEFVIIKILDFVLYCLKKGK